MNPKCKGCVSEPPNATLCHKTNMRLEYDDQWNDECPCMDCLLKAICTDVCLTKLDYAILLFKTESNQNQNYIETLEEYRKARFK